MDHINFKSQSTVQDQHYLFLDSQEDMVRREHDGLSDSADVGQYHWVDPKLIRIISFTRA